MDKDKKALYEHNKQLMKEVKDLRENLEKKDDVLEMYMELNVEKNETIEKLREGVDFAQSNSGANLSKLSHVKKAVRNILGEPEPNKN